MRADRERNKARQETIAAVIKLAMSSGTFKKTLAKHGRHGATSMNSSSH